VKDIEGTRQNGSVTLGEGVPSFKKKILSGSNEKGGGDCLLKTQDSREIVR